MDIQHAPELKMIRGDTPTWKMTFSRGGAPVSLTSALIWMTAKKKLTDADPGVFMLVTGSGITVTDAANGIATVTPSNVNTQTLEDADQTLYYDVQLKESGGRLTSFRGKLLIECDITQSIT